MRRVQIGTLRSPAPAGCGGGLEERLLRAAGLTEPGRGLQMLASCRQFQT